MRTQSACAALLFTVVVGLSAVGPAQATGELKLVGAPVLLDSNIGQGSGGKLEHFNAVIRVKNTFTTAQNVVVGFTVKQGGKVIKTETAKAGIRPGGGVVVADLVLPKKGTRTVEARFTGFSPASTSAAFVAARFVGTPRLVHDQVAGCSMTARLSNPSKEALSSEDVFLIGVQGDRIVAAGRSSLFDDVKPGAIAPIKVDFISCVKVGAVLAYLESDGGF